MAEPTATAGVRRCPRCGETRPLDAFSIARSKASGRSSYCKSCDNASRREAYYCKLGRLVPSVRPARVIRRCELCDSEITGQGKRFCSLDCANQHLRRPEYIRVCPVCDEQFKVDGKHLTKRICSKECRRSGMVEAVTCDLPASVLPVLPRHVHRARQAQVVW